MSLRERSIMILDALSTEHGPETFVSDGYAYYEDALGALIAFAREIRNEALEEVKKEITSRKIHSGDRPVMIHPEAMIKAIDDLKETHASSQQRREEMTMDLRIVSVYYLGFSIGAGFNLSTPKVKKNHDDKDWYRSISLVAHLLGVQICLWLPLWRD